MLLISFGLLHSVLNSFFTQFSMNFTNLAKNLLELSVPGFSHNLHVCDMRLVNSNLSLVSFDRFELLMRTRHAVECINLLYPIIP